mmetsp:Transcript_3767/g.7894  ORF Transcript_3767/g.7894 Transcript_3767/m.7894 type:complete len:349 (+) Transcript_3767:643-1689(+)
MRPGDGPPCVGQDNDHASPQRGVPQVLGDERRLDAHTVRTLAAPPVFGRGFRPQNFPRDYGIHAYHSELPSDTLQCAVERDGLFGRQEMLQRVVERSVEERRVRQDLDLGPSRQDGRLQHNPPSVYAGRSDERLLEKLRVRQESHSVAKRERRDEPRLGAVRAPAIVAACQSRVLPGPSDHEREPPEIDLLAPGEQDEQPFAAGDDDAHRVDLGASRVNLPDHAAPGRRRDQSVDVGRGVHRSPFARRVRFRRAPAAPRRRQDGPLGHGPPGRQERVVQWEKRHSVRSSVSNLLRGKWPSRPVRALLRLVETEAGAPPADRRAESPPGAVPRPEVDHAARAPRESRKQ